MHQEKTIVEPSLPIMEAFYTLQGEGAFQGQAAYFIRIGGCDVGCFWCDVKESWDAKAHPSLSYTQLIEQASQYPARLAVITGGEPLMYNLNEFTAALQKAGFRRHIETSGAYPLSGTWDWICFSPKRFKQPDESIYLHANELKVVILSPQDFEWAEVHASKVNADCKLYLQPEWEKSKRILPLIIDYVKQNPKWRVSLQVHKYMDIP